MQPSYLRFPSGGRWVGMGVSRFVGVLGGAKAGAVVAAVAGVALCSTIVLHTSKAMFAGSTDNPSNSWSTGTVALSDDDSGTALFSSADGPLTGGTVLTRCIIVTYDGTLPASVKFYGTATDTLAPYLNLTVDQGPGGSGTRDCSGAVATPTSVFSGTLFGLTAASTAGLGTWAASSVATSMTYKFTITVQTVVGAQGKTASALFSWNAQG